MKNYIKIIIKKLKLVSSLNYIVTTKKKKKHQRIK